MKNTLPSLEAQRLHEQIGSTIKNLKKNAFTLGSLLDQMKDGKHYKTFGYSTFEEYCEIAHNFKRSNARYLISAAKVFQNVHHGAQNTEPPQNERQARELAKAPPEEQAEIWTETQERTQKTQPAAREIKETIEMKTKEVEPIIEAKPKTERKLFLVISDILKSGKHYAMTYEEYENSGIRQALKKGLGGTSFLRTRHVMFVETTDLLKNPYNQRTDSANFRYYTTLWISKTHRPDTYGYVRDLEPKIFVSEKNEEGNSIAEWLVKTFNK